MCMCTSEICVSYITLIGFTNAVLQRFRYCATQGARDWLAEYNQTSVARRDEQASDCCKQAMVNLMR
jgi:hypothetical protein